MVLKNMIVYMLLSSLAVNMVPDKSCRPYISLACGLILMLLLLNPVVSIISDDGSILQSIEGYMDTGITVSEDMDFSLSDIMGAVDAASDFLADLPDYETVSALETVRGSLSDMGAELKNIDVTRDENGEIIKITVSVIYEQDFLEDAGEDRAAGNIKLCVSGVYNVSEENIYVVFV